MKPKTINFELIPQDHDAYRLLTEARNAWHEDLRQARIALAWRKALKPNKDGQLVLGKCVKISDMHKELADYDFVILLNREVWHMAQFDEAKKLALLDHELCHAAPTFNDEGEQKYDERRRPVWRCRKHDIEEFQFVVAHHGCYKRDLVEFAAVLMEQKKGESLFGEPEPEEKAGDSITSCQITVLNDDGTPGASVSFDDPIRTMQETAEAIREGATLPAPEDGVVTSRFIRKHVSAEIVVRADECGWTSSWRLRTRTASEGDDCLGTFDSESEAREAAACSIGAYVASMNGSTPEKARANFTELQEWCSQWIPSQQPEATR